MSPRATLGSRVRDLEEEKRISQIERNRLSKSFDNQVVRCTNIFEGINQKLNVVNSEQGELRNEIVGLRKEIAGIKELINIRVSAPMSGKERAGIYISLITSLASITVALITAFVV